MIAKLFTHPIILSFYTILWLVLPLCASMAVVYKTIRVNNIRRMPMEAGVLLIYMVVGLGTLGAALWAVQAYWP
ncbi:MAG: hypothetical protein QF577_00310 [Phycisphaerae bacterium]|jgi:hypothetical protein|nr:hypothetical protein [Phycisphaerae bacterium]